MTEVVSHQATEIVQQRANVDILEFGPEFFHPGSPLLMPSKVGDEDKIPGVKALAVVYKQGELDPRKRIVVAAHADSEDGGSPFELADARAKNVVYLLRGDVNWWSRLCRDYHLIKDYKRILKYFQVRRLWECDPGAIDDAWNDQTRQAVATFVEQYNADCDGELLPGIVDTIDADSEHRWPTVLWKAVYKLYQEDIAEALGVDVEDLPGRRRRFIKFVSRRKNFVACGDSFPLVGEEDKSLNNYNQDKKRRAEILFFFGGEGPGQHGGALPFTCPGAGDEKHLAEECPLWYAGNLKANYLDPAEELTAIVYHLVFAYYNLVKQEILRVPEGLPLKAYYYRNIADRTTKTAINARVNCQDGYYTVKFQKAADQENVFFEFETPDPADATKKSQWWVFTTDSDAPMIEKTTAFPNLMRDDLAWRRRYYDLPKEWCSENYWTRVKVGDGYSAERYLEMVRDVQKLKPFPGQSGSTTADKPLFFSLDDIVLVDANGSQEIKDREWDSAGGADFEVTAEPPWNEADADVSEDFSQFSLFHVKNGDLVLYKPKHANAPYYTDLKFKDGLNLITDVPAETRLIAFANKFYSVFEKRAGQDGWAVDFDEHQIKGCRAACLSDPNNHCGMTVLSTAGPGHFRYFARYCGNFELHYVHRGCVIQGPDGLETRSFLLVYWSGLFEAFQHATDDGHAVTDDDVHKFARDGLMNAKTRWESKGYTIEPHIEPPAPATLSMAQKLQIKPVFFFERKEIQSDPVTWADVCLGGAPKCKVFVHNNPDINDMGATFSRMYYKSSAIHDYLGVGTSPRDIDGLPGYKTLTVAHELSHAKGKMDEYAYESGDISDFAYNAADQIFSQYYPGMPYHIDKGSMMVTNRSTRMKHLWGFVNRLNDAAENPAELQPVLGGTKYEVVHRFSRAPNKLNFWLKYVPANPAAVPPVVEVDYRDFCKPYKDTKTAGAPLNTGTGAVDLALYKLGPDEMSWNLKVDGRMPRTQPFDGILVVYVKVIMALLNGTDASGNPLAWTNAGATAWRDKLKAELSLAERFYLQSTVADSEFKNTYLLFFPVCVWLPLVDPAKQGGAINAAHYRIILERNNTNGVTSPRPAGTVVLTVGNKSSQRWVARYMYGADGGGADTSTVTRIGAADLNWLRDWVRNQLGDNSFVIKEALDF